MLVVLGGDRTIHTAAEACAGTDTYLLPLPGGTLNLLPPALYGDVSWQDALRITLADPLTKTLSRGRTGDELFFVAAIVGAPRYGWKRANPYAKATVLMPLRRMPSLFKQCSTHKFGIPFHLQQVMKLRFSPLPVPSCRKKYQIPSKRLRSLLSVWRTPPNYAGSRPRQRLENGVMMKA